MRQLLKADVQVVSTESLSEDACSGVRKLKVLSRFKQNTVGLHENTQCRFCLLQESDARIIIGHFEEDSASEVFCCVSTLHGQKYVDTPVVCFGPFDLMKGNLDAVTYNDICDEICSSTFCV